MRIALHEGAAAPSRQWDKSQYTGSPPSVGTAKDGVPQPTTDVEPPETKQIVENGCRLVPREATSTPRYESTAVAALAKDGDEIRSPVLATNVSPSR